MLLTRAGMEHRARRPVSHLRASVGGQRPAVDTSLRRRTLLLLDYGTVEHVTRITTNY